MRQIITHHRSMDISFKDRKVARAQDKLDEVFKFYKILNDIEFFGLLKFDVDCGRDFIGDDMPSLHMQKRNVASSS